MASEKEETPEKRKDVLNGEYFGAACARPAHLSDTHVELSAGQEPRSVAVVLKNFQESARIGRGFQHV